MANMRSSGFLAGEEGDASVAAAVKIGGGMLRPDAARVAETEWDPRGKAGGDAEDEEEGDMPSMADGCRVEKDGSAYINCT